MLSLYLRTHVHQQSDSSACLSESLASLECGDWRDTLRSRCSLRFCTVGDLQERSNNAGHRLPLANTKVRVGPQPVTQECQTNHNCWPQPAKQENTHSGGWLYGCQTQPVLSLCLRVRRSIELHDAVCRHSPNGVSLSLSSFLPRRRARCRTTGCRPTFKYTL